MTLDDGAYQFSAQDGTLTFAYAYIDSRLTVTLECEPGAGTGAPSAVTGAAPDFAVTWKTSAACSAATAVSAFPPTSEGAASEAVCVAGLDATNYNGATLDTVVGITDQAACCDACSKNLKCQRWVLGARPVDLPHSPRQL